MGHPRIFISAGEASGDLHGAGLIRALRTLAPEAEIVALGGPRMQAAGARLFANTVDFGIIGVLPIFGSFWRYLELLSRTDRFFGAWRPDVAVTIDCPGFHFLLASRMRARRVPLLWYIPPQLWAWAPWRVRKLRRRYTRVACILPHEETFFRNAGVP
ncbi:MAG: lipid-A-disaccharide synthase, partial [Planctomycetota bacterium]|nr:lipid-A-disaccharide synthase [Planctomycetota bacterium]